MRKKGMQYGLKCDVVIYDEVTGNKGCWSLFEVFCKVLFWVYSKVFLNIDNL